MKELQQAFEISQRRACAVLGQPRSSQRYVSEPRGDEAELVTRMLQLSRERPRFGYLRIGSLLRAECLALEEFETVGEAIEVIGRWC